MGGLIGLIIFGLFLYGILKFFEELGWKGTVIWIGAVSLFFGVIIGVTSLWRSSVEMKVSYDKSCDFKTPLLVSVVNKNPFVRVSLVRFEFIINKHGHSTDLSSDYNNKWDVIVDSGKEISQCYSLPKTTDGYVEWKPDEYSYSAKVKRWE